MTRRRHPELLTAALGAVLASIAGVEAQGAAPPPLLRNGAFFEWKEGAPVAWQARHAQGPLLGRHVTVSPGTNGHGLVLHADTRTTAWTYLAQDVEAEPGKVYRVEIDAELTAPGGAAASFFGVAARGKAGMHRRLTVLHPGGAERDAVYFRAPPDARRAEVFVRLSSTGRLAVSRLTMTVMPPDSSFDVLVRDMDRHYSYFAHKKVDWKALTDGFRDRMQAASDANAFVVQAVQMLAALRDGHVHLVDPAGKLHQPYLPPRTLNFDFKRLRGELRVPRQFGRAGLVAKTADGFGYVLLASFRNESSSDLAELLRALDGLLDCPGLIFDVRGNGGGNDAWAAQIASRLTDREVVYSTTRVRAGTRHDAFSAPRPQSIKPRKGPVGRPYSRPIVCLAGSFTMSSAEAFVMMMKALPHARVIGEPTRGSSGNPSPLDLPNGVTVHYSRWVQCLPDGSVLEGRGVVPDQAVAWSEDGADSVFSAGLTDLRQRTRARGR
ncbi:MAG: S41 family peptidase [Planctomycetes bacterium]|nr:S41 family peptidase [Planctomycetota bacterium]MCB9872163.1 S41 family peptidase [Planctomycetota bacterium]